MSRFLKVMGKPGLLVADPFRARGATPHFLGQQEKAVPPKGNELNLADFYEPCEQVVKCDDPGARSHVLTAQKNGELVVLAECVASTRSDADHKMAQVAPAAKSGKRGE